MLPHPGFEGEALFSTQSSARVNELHFKSDPDSKLKSIIAIHNTKLSLALGGCLCIEYDNIESIDCNIIVGSANNQLATEKHGQVLHEKGILYAPDYIINAGGLIQVSLGNLRCSLSDITNKTWGICETLLEIFNRAKAENLPPSVIADQLAEEILYGTSH